jgi:hypothetical protein
MATYRSGNCVDDRHILGGAVTLSPRDQGQTIRSLLVRSGNTTWFFDRWSTSRCQGAPDEVNDVMMTLCSACIALARQDVGSARINLLAADALMSLAKFGT